MLTIGVDLAAEPKGTAVACIDWGDERATLDSLIVGATDRLIVEASSEADKIGIDCALGWPDRFVDFLMTHRSSGHVVSDGFGDIDWRRELAYRETDRRVRQSLGRWPLSVATDRLGVTALRCAGLLTRLAEAGIDIDRSGRGGVVEVYPAGSLEIWHLRSPGYRRSADARASMVKALATQAPWFDLSRFIDVMIESCDALDAVVASLSARAVALGFATLPTGADLTVARTEGWIALPTTGLAELIAGDG